MSDFDSDSSSVHSYKKEEASHTTTTLSGATAPPTAFLEPPSHQERTLDPEEISDSESTTDTDTDTEAIPTSASSVWSDLQEKWRYPVIASGHFREGQSVPESALWLQNNSLLDLFLQADQALPVEQQIMSGTKIKLRALQRGDDYLARLTAPVKSVGLLSGTQTGDWQATLPSHDMTATLEIRARCPPSASDRALRSSEYGNVLRRGAWPTTLVADLGNRSFAERQRGTARGPSVDRRIEDPFRFPMQIPRNCYSAVGLSDPALYMFGAGISPESGEYADNDSGSFDFAFQVNDTYTQGPWKFAFEASDAGLRPEYNRRVNEDLIETFGQPVAVITLHLDFEARTAEASSSRD